MDFKLGTPLAGNAQADSARLGTVQFWGLAPTIDDGAGRVRVERSVETADSERGHFNCRDRNRGTH